MESRQLKLKNWVEQVLKQPVIFEPILGDASFRHYYRVSGPAFTQIAVDTPPAQENNEGFLQISAFLLKVGVVVPRLIASALDQGFMLLEDFGNKLLFESLDIENATKQYQKSVEVLLHLSILPRPDFLPEYNGQHLMSEMALFDDWFMRKLIPQGCISFNADEWSEHWLSLTELLTAEALAQPQVFVHRDFHSRNIMCLPSGKLGLIDFQDAVWGPLTYDLVSLFKDCYISWPREFVLQWALGFFFHWQKIRKEMGHLADRKAETVPDISEAQFIRWFDWMGMQRHLKALGIFARLWLRDQKPGYLKEMPRTLDYLIEVCDEYSELKFVQPLFSSLQGVMNQDALRSLFVPFKH